MLICFSGAEGARAHDPKGADSDPKAAHNSEIPENPSWDFLLALNGAHTPAPFRAIAILLSVASTATAQCCRRFTSGAQPPQASHNRDEFGRCQGLGEMRLESRVQGTRAVLRAREGV